MCYQIPGEITKTGKPIVGGLDIDQSDYDFAALIYPKKLKTQRVAKIKTAPARAAGKRGAKKKP